MSVDTALPNRFQEKFEQAIRDVISGVSHMEGIVIREIPDPSLDEEVDIPEVPEFDGVSIESFEGEQRMGVDLYFKPIPEGEVIPIPDDTTTAPEYVFEKREEHELTYLKELGGEYAELSESLLKTLSAYCDAPEHDRGRQFGGDEPDFLFTMFPKDGVASFNTQVFYPEYVEEIYTDGDEAAARRFGLPY
jgi:hypothetical protein